MPVVDKSLIVMDQVSGDVGVPACPARASEQAPSPLLLPDLLNDFDRLAGLLPEQLRAGRWLNAFLLAAGLNQIVEDYLHPDPLSLGRAAKHLARLPRPAGALSAGLARGLGAGLDEKRVRTPGVAGLERWQAAFASLVLSLACVAVGVEHAGDQRRLHLLNRTEELLAAARSFPERLRHSILRLPSCFRSFDQHPEDLERLVRDFSLQSPDRSTSVVSIGLRTSGSYLAPLVAAYLQGQGYERVHLLTLRPGRHLLPRERSFLARLGRSGGIALVTDDPPASGGSLAQAGGQLERAGIAADCIVLLLPLFGPPSSLPKRVARYRSLVLPWEDWSVNRRLAPEAVRRTLCELLGPELRVEHVQQVDRPARRWERSHAHGLYSVDVSAGQGGATRRLMIGVKGAGLGYFGQHSLAVAERLGEYLPETYGLRDGLLYRAWLDEDRRVSHLAGSGCSLDRTVVEGIAGYVAARARRLPAERDTALELAGHKPAWEATANMLCRAYGLVGLAMRPLAVDAAVKQLLAVEHPSVTDGEMDLARWFVGPDGSGKLLKIDPDERDFSNLDLACYDPVFDLAGAAVSEAGDGWPDGLRRAYEAATGEVIDEERWLLYQLLQLREGGHAGCMDGRSVDRAAERALQRYYAARYLATSRTGRGGNILGPLVALDLDGVLETQVLGFPGLTPASAQALGALMAHAYRPVLVTGRSLDEVRERCDAYGLAGGAAEYGSVIYLKEGDRTLDVLQPEERDALERLRSAVRDMPGVEVDPGYQRAVRAYRMKAGGDWRERRALSPDQVQAALNEAEVDGPVRSVQGHFQTDFVAARIDKGVGLQVLVSELTRASAQSAAKDVGPRALRTEEPGRARLVALAVGDTEADLPMLALAKHAWAPANADAAVRRSGVRVSRRRYQAGLAEAVGTLLGHTPGCCAECRTLELPPSARLLADVLAAHEDGTLAMAWRALRLAVRVRSVRPLSRS